MMTKKLVITIIILFLLSSICFAQNIKIGMNLSEPFDWGSEWPFVNIMKYSRTWITFNHPDYTGEHPWDTGFYNSIPMDEDGYPLEVPFEVEEADTLQMVRTVWANPYQLSEGEYILLYDGEGVIDFWGDAEITSQEPGRIVVQVTPQIDGIIIMEIHESSPDNHIRNIRFLLPGTEFTYEEDPWSDEWLEKLEPFKVLRLKDWGKTDNSSMVTWNERTDFEDYTYTQRSGVPYERWIELCNMKQADAWVSIPHRADENYVTQMATLFRDSLDTDLKIYVEYSNELWNWIFDQAHYGVDSLDQNLEWPERLAPRIAEVMEIWTDVFGDESYRLIRVLGCQHGWFDIGNRIFAQLVTDGDDDLIDAISPAAYMTPDHAQLDSLGAEATPQDVIEGAAAFTFDPEEYSMEGWYLHAQLASEYNKLLVYYEAGQHFTPEPWGTIQPYNEALMGAQEAPEMYDLYMQLFDTLSVFSDMEQTFMHFQFIAPLWEDPNQGAYGNFGALTSQFYQFPPYTEAPKYRALVDYIEEYGTDVEESHWTQSIPYTHLSQNYPNPFNPVTTIAFDLAVSGDVSLKIYDISGRLVKTLVNEERAAGSYTINWSGDNEQGQSVPSGVYFYCLEGEDFEQINRMVLLK